MKLLIVTRKVDIHDERMGFFVPWLNEFAKHVEKLQVISIQEGSSEGLAENIVLHSIGGNKIKKFFTYKKLLKQLVPEVDGIFIHMMPLYANIAGPYSVKHDKKLFLWYMHRSVDKALWNTQKWVSGYITASKESFRLETPLPVHIVGHAIPAERFGRADTRSTFGSNTEISLLTTGRVAPVKHLEVLIEAVRILVTTYNLQPTLSIVGSPAVDADKKYLETLKGLVAQYGLSDRVLFLGSRTYQELPEVYHHADLFVSASDTGSLDKAVLEAMAAGVIPITSSSAFAPLFGANLEHLTFPEGDAHTLSQRIVAVYSSSSEERQAIKTYLHDLVVRDHDLSRTITNILTHYA